MEIAAVGGRKNWADSRLSYRGCDRFQSFRRGLTIEGVAHYATRSVRPTCGFLKMLLLARKDVQSTTLSGAIYFIRNL